MKAFYTHFIFLMKAPNRVKNGKEKKVVKKSKNSKKSENSSGQVTYEIILTFPNNKSKIWGNVRFQRSHLIDMAQEFLKLEILFAVCGCAWVSEREREGKRVGSLPGRAFGNVYIRRKLKMWVDHYIDINLL